MRVLRAARRALLFFIVVFALSLGVGASADTGGSLIAAAYLAAIVSGIGMTVASLVAVVAQIYVVLVRLGRRVTING